tara:strand:+ start:320 stop:523 length:204 start_codon:yes stop_codon:yes gene_type:complete
MAMLFELREERTRPAAITGMVVSSEKRIATRPQDQVKDRYHTMKIGQRICLSGDATTDVCLSIVRVK